MQPLELMPGAQPFFYPGGRIGCLLIHGLTGTPQELRWLGQYLNRQGCTVYGPRLAGHGTTPHDLAHTTWREWYHDALAGFEMLRRMCGPVFVIGLSMGGVLSLTLAARQPVSGVVAMATPHDVPICRSRQRYFLPLLRLLRPFVPKNDAPEYKRFEERILAEQRARGEEVVGHPNYAVWPARAVAEFCRLLAEMRAGLPRITAPALFIYSQADDVVPVENLHRNLQAIGSERKESLILQKSLHLVAEDVEREQVFERVWAFVREQAGEMKTRLTG